MRRLLLVATMMLAVFSMGCTSMCKNVCPLARSGSWRLAYAHDASGNRTAGDIDTLIEAVRAGSPVRVLLNHGSYEYSPDIDHVWIRDGIVNAQTAPLTSSRFDSDRMVFIDGTFDYYFNFSTRGYRDIIEWKVGEHTPGPSRHYHDQVALKWFVQ